MTPLCPPGMDPTVDLSFLGPAIKVQVQGKASNWLNNLKITNTTGSGGTSYGTLVIRHPCHTAPLSYGTLPSSRAFMRTLALFHGAVVPLCVVCPAFFKCLLHTPSHQPPPHPTPINPSGEGAEQLDASEAARLFEGALAKALLQEDGQLAISRLAASLTSLMPKLETQGQLGKARCAMWRQCTHDCF